MLTIDFRHFPLVPGDRVLDLGCGEGRHAIHCYLEAEVTVIAVDLNHRDLLTAAERFAPFADPDNPQRHFSLHQANGQALPFADASFDKVVCSEVLEHIHDYHAVLQEIRRILKPGGLLAVSVPRAWPERLCWRLSQAYHQVEGGHVRIFDATELRRDIETRQLHHYHRHWAHALHAPFWWLKCLFWHRQEESRLIRAYHRLLVWDLMERPWLTRTLEQLLNPLLGKSVVMYFKHPLPENHPSSENSDP